MQKKKQSGITLVSLIMTILLMIILVSVTVSVSTDRFMLVKINNMYADIDQLKDAIDLYYMNNNLLPVIENKTQDVSKIDPKVFSANDNNTYYIIDFDKLDMQNINYGMGYSKIKDGKSSDDIYIINEKSHIIYYYAGFTYKGETYYRKKLEDKQIDDNIAPSKPEINVISGTKNEEEIYTTQVEIEIVPGKDNWSGVLKTTYTINNGTETDISKLENNKYKIVENGTYEIKARSYDINGNISEYNSMTIVVDIPKPISIGDYVMYNLEYTDMYTGYNFTEKDGWRYIGQDADGNYLIVSTGIPAILNYNFNTENRVNWWGEDDEVKNTYGEEYSKNGWNYNNNEGWIGAYVAYGLRYKFTSIQFTYKETGKDVETLNTGIFRKIAKNENGNITGEIFKVRGVNIVDVHNLTLEELNNARGCSITDSTSTSTKDGAQGLFYLRGLEIENKNYLYTKDSYVYYWLANLHTQYKNLLRSINFYGNIYDVGNGNFGVRPVITLTSDTNLIDTNKDEIYEIK